MAIARRKEVYGTRCTHSALTWVWALAWKRESERGVGVGAGVGVGRLDIGPREMGGYEVPVGGYEVTVGVDGKYVRNWDGMSEVGG